MLEQKTYLEKWIVKDYYRNKDLEEISITHFYTEPLGSHPLNFGASRPLSKIGSHPLNFGTSRPLSKIGSQGSGFLKGSKGNIYKEIKLPDFILQERVDASDLNNIHINYDIKGIPRRISKQILKDFHKIDL